MLGKDNKMENEFWTFIMYNFCIWVSLFLYKINERRHPFEGFSAFILLAVLIMLWNTFLWCIGCIDYKALPKY